MVKNVEGLHLNIAKEEPCYTTTFNKLFTPQELGPAFFIYVQESLLRSGLPNMADL